MFSSFSSTLAVNDSVIRNGLLLSYICIFLWYAHAHIASMIYRSRRQNLTM